MGSLARQLRRSALVWSETMGCPNVSGETNALRQLAASVRQLSWACWATCSRTRPSFLLAQRLLFRHWSLSAGFGLTTSTLPVPAVPPMVIIIRSALQGLRGQPSASNYRLLIFASCIVLFQLANASLLPLVSEELARDHGSSLVISALIFVPQIMVAILAPWVGRGAGRWGRRPLLLIGLGALPIRAACLALVDDPVLLVAVQMLDGISGAVIGVLTPLVIADITKGTGRFNLGQGIVGTFSGIGAALSTTVSGYVAQSFGGAAGFYAMMGVALAAVAVCWAFMPETRGARSVPELGTVGEGGERSTVHTVL